MRPEAAEGVIQAVLVAARSPRVAQALAHTGRFLRRRTREQRLTEVCAVVPGILGRMGRDIAESPSWSVKGASWTETGTALVRLGPPNDPACAILRIAGEASARRALVRQASVLRTLNGLDELGDWRRLLPQPLAEGEIDGQLYVVEEAMAGQAMWPLENGQSPLGLQQLAAIEAISKLHERTARVATVESTALLRWVDEPVAMVRALEGPTLGGRRAEAALDRLAADLYAMLRGRSFPLSWIHGDFWPGNILVGPDTLHVAGIVDWDQAAADELPVLDVLHLLLYSRALARRKELGDVLRQLLAGEDWSEQERQLLSSAGVEWPNNRDEARALLLLYWLRHVASNLVQSARYARNWVWVRTNIAGVLNCV